MGAFFCINSSLLGLRSLVFGFVRAAGFRDHVDAADSKLIARARGAGRSSWRACCTGIASVNNDGVPNMSGEILPASQRDLLTFFLPNDRAALRTETAFELLVALGIALALVCGELAVSGVCCVGIVLGSAPGGAVLGSFEGFCCARAQRPKANVAAIVNTVRFTGSS